VRKEKNRRSSVSNALATVIAGGMQIILVAGAGAFLLAVLWIMAGAPNLSEFTGTPPRTGPGPDAYDQPVDPVDHESPTDPRDGHDDYDGPYDYDVDDNPYGGGWTCNYDPTMNRDWHDDVLCTNGAQEDRPYLLPNDSYITRDDIMRAAQQHEAVLNGG
jgi:hypothetical protein